MRQAARTARYDQALGLEAYSLRAVDRPFPSHFHDHYVIGVVERGTRTLTCGRNSRSSARETCCCSTRETAMPASRRTGPWTTGD